MCPERHLLLHLRSSWWVDEKRLWSISNCKTGKKMSIKPTHEARQWGSLIIGWAQTLWDRDIYLPYLFQSLVSPSSPTLYCLPSLYDKSLIFSRVTKVLMAAEAPLQVWIGFDHTTPSFVRQTQPSELRKKWMSESSSPEASFILPPD